MMMIKRVMMLAAWAFVACCPSIVNSFVYRSAKFAYNANSMLDKRVKVGKTTGAPSGKTVDGAGVGRSSGGVAIEGKVRIPRVPSALDPEGVTRRVDSLLHILGKGEDGEGVPVPNDQESVPSVREGAMPPSNDNQQQLIQEDQSAGDGIERRLHLNGLRPRGRYPGWATRTKGFQRRCGSGGFYGLRSTSPAGAGVGDGFCSICDIERTPHEVAALTAGTVGYHDSAVAGSSGTCPSEPSSDIESVPVKSGTTEKYGITADDAVTSNEVKYHHSGHDLEIANGSSELPSRAVDARPLHKRVEPIQDDKNSAPTHDGSNPTHTRIVHEVVSDGQGNDRKKAGRSYPHEVTGRSFFSLNLQEFDGTEDFNQGPSLTLPYFPAENPRPPVQPGATPTATAAAGHGTASRPTPPPPPTDSAAEATAEEAPDYVDMLTTALHDAWGRGTIRSTSHVSTQDDITAAPPSSRWWPADGEVAVDDLPQVYLDAWRKRGARGADTLSVGGAAPTERQEWSSSTLSEGDEKQAKTNDDTSRKVAPASQPPKNGRVRRWLGQVRRGWANRRSSRPRRRRNDLTW